jgi:HEAT repeat protein
MPTFSESHRMGRRGINLIARLCEEMGQIWREISVSDVGFDGEIELVEGLNTTGQIIKVQGKAGRSYIRNEKPDQFDFYADANHLEYWQGANNPVILVIYDPEDDLAYWHDVQKYLKQYPEVVTNRSHKITFSKTQNRFNPETAEALKAVFGASYVEAKAAHCQQTIERFAKLTLYSISSDMPISVDLERVFVKLTATQKQVREGAVGSEKLMEDFVSVNATDMGTMASAEFYQRFGETSGRHGSKTGANVDDPIMTLSIADLLRNHESIAIIGVPGAGKTTLLKYLALTFARNQARDRLQLDEERLPIFVTLRDFNRYLANLDKRGQLGTIGPRLLPRFLQEHTLELNPQLLLPEDFFARALDNRQCVVLLDGLDEVADPLQRARTAEAVASLIAQFKGNRFVITSRPRGYESEARQRLSPFCAVCAIREFDEADRGAFSEAWYTAVITDREGNNATSHAKAREAAGDLLRAIHGDARITALATNPLLLSILALVHQRGVGLPQRRADLYNECTQMLLGYWDQTKGGEAAKELARYGELDRSEKRTLLEPIALWLHERGESGLEVDARELETEIARLFRELFGDLDPQARQRAQLFLRVITERTGLMVEREVGVYSFAHLTFQEYLAARAIADRSDYVDYTLNRLHDPWWREVILLEAGHLSGPNSRRSSELTMELLRAIRCRKSWLESVLHRDLLLVGRSLCDIAELGIDKNFRRDVIQELLGLWQSTPYETQRRAIEEIFSYAVPTVIRTDICDFLLRLLTGHKSELRQRAEATMLQLGEKIVCGNVLTKLLELTASINIDVRTSATVLLGGVGEKSQIDAVTSRLLELSQDDDAKVRSSAAMALGKLCGKAKTDIPVERLIRMLEDSEKDVRSAASWTLRDMRRTPAINLIADRLLEWVRDRDNVPEEAMHVLYNLGIPTVSNSCFQELIKLSHRNDKKRVAARILGAWGEIREGAIEQMLLLCRDPDLEVQGSAIGSLAGLLNASLRSGGGHDTERILTELLQYCGETSDLEKVKVGFEFGSSGDNESWGHKFFAVVNVYLLKSSPTGKPELRHQASAMLVFNSYPNATIPESLIRHLVELSQSSSQSVRIGATLVIGSVAMCRRTELSLDRLFQLTNDANRVVRSAAVWAIGGLGTRAATNAVLTRLSELCTDSDSSVRCLTAWALARCSTVDSFSNVSDQLLILTQDKNEKVRCEAAWSLCALGDKAATKAVIDRLLQLCVEPNELVRLQAVLVLGKIGNSAGTQLVHSHLAKLTKCGASNIGFAAVEALTKLKGEEDARVLRSLIEFWRVNLRKSKNMIFAGDFGNTKEFAFTELNRLGALKFRKAAVTNKRRRNS